MSEVYWNIGSRHSLTNLPKSDPLGKVSSDSWYPRSACEWSREISWDLINFFNKCQYPLRLITQIPYEEPLRSEIRRFFISLDAYIESPNPVIPYRDILYGATNKDYATFLKRVKRKSFESTWRVEHFEFPDWWNEVPEYRISDIGDIFNYSYLIFWKEDVDDYKYGWEPLNISEDSLRKLKGYAREILPERSLFEKIEKLETTSSLSSSIAVERKSLKNIPHYKIKNKYLSLSEKRHLVKRSVIPVSPANIRDTVLNDPGDLNTISLIDQQTMEILRVMPNHIHLTNKDKVTRRLRNLYNKCSLFLQRDIRKEGITKPRVILRVLLEVLHELYPDIEVYQYYNFYDDYEIEIDSTIQSPPRGHGLGMANALTTLMQLVIHQWIIDELTNDLPDIYSKMLCINDDFTAGFNSEEHLDAYWDKEDEVMSQLSLLREPTKSFKSEKRFVLAERYFTVSGEYEKTSYQLRELLYPLTCYNIVHAKEYFSAAQVFCDQKYVNRYICDIVSYWGYELYPNEFSYPTIASGWINERINGVDMSLILLDKLPFNSFVCRGIESAKVKIKYRGKGNLVRPPILDLLGILQIPEEFEEYFDFLPQNLLDRKYGRILSRSNKLFSNYWDRLLHDRRKVFSKFYECPYEEVINDLLNHYSNFQFYPSDIMIKQYHKGDFFRVNIDDIYIDPNAKLACLSKYNLIDYKFKESFSIRFTNPDATTKKSQSLFSKEIQRALKSEITSSLTIGNFNEIYYPRGDYHPEEQYLNPIKIGEITSILNWGKGYPELLPNYVHPLIKEKREVFNYLFSLDELIKISRYRMSRSTIKEALRIRRDNQSFLELMEELEDLYSTYQENFEEDEDILSTQEIEDEYHETAEDRMVDHTFEDHRYEDTDETLYLSMRDFLDEERSYRVWQAINRSGRRIEYLENTVAYHLFYTSNLSASLGHQLRKSPESVNHMLNEYKTGAGPIAVFILKNIGLFDNLMNFINETEPELEDLEMGDLFGW
jgi:hypothetical protein